MKAQLLGVFRCRGGIGFGQRRVVLCLIMKVAIENFNQFSAVAGKVAGVMIEGGQDFGNQSGRLACLASQGLDLSHHNGESLAGFTGPCGFNGGVECQQIRLARDRIDLIGNTRDPANLLGQAFDLFLCILNRVSRGLNLGVRH